ncbi:putative adenylate kinase 7, mitochondrial [Capsicum chinense]|nr:putative adenylate kinase 7, mitochondrial [Capsicum chinense]
MAGVSTGLSLSIGIGIVIHHELHPCSTVYKQIADVVNQEKLFLEEVIFGLLSKRLEEGYCRGEIGFILGGIPRSEIKDEIPDKTVDTDLVLNLKCAEDLVSKKDKSTRLYPLLEFLFMGIYGINTSR